MEIAGNTVSARQRRPPRLILYANDINPEHSQSVKEALNENFEDGRVECNVTTKDYHVCLEDTVLLTRKKRRKSFVFLDPYGYKDISIDDLRKLLSSGSCEVLLWLPASHMSRFRSNGTPDSLERIQDDLGLTSVEFDRLPAGNRQRGYIDLLLEGFRSTFRNAFVDSFYIKADATTHHAMFFFTPHIKGAEKLLESKWAIDNEEGRGWSYEKNSDGLFGDSVRVNELERELRDVGSILYEPEGASNVEMYQLAIANGFLPKHLTEVFKSMKDLAVCPVKPGEKVRKGAHYINYKRFKESDAKIRFKLPQR